ncbi:helix-turn-helix domain-containing protein [Geomesophilobacter sediminis]|uniref:Helix-turn-helix transcriptional regulator n=1 Tax=Geomesophilobacter sediminis TaxID=2798584 RepID=A0A8J7JMU6_9BACT|nr:helix-turn-helix transcriptional regulator [Geomesophilobacter sediminis]MBJ6726170.1 helix-turn-helix transcriptional regulator [Geomesophilobacter sediminis]
MAQDSEIAKKGTPLSVALDGSRIRACREQKRLTQLYIANIVGVTTDTISRWENNRYPTIRRDNAEKLAEALEVDLEAILRDVAAPLAAPVEIPPEVPPPAAAKRRTRLLWLLVATLIVAAVAVPILLRQLGPAPVAVRWAPKFAAPGEIIPIQVKVTRQQSDRNAFILKERLPQGWSLVTTTPTTAMVESPGWVVKWLIAQGIGPATISYTARIPDNATVGAEVPLNGEVIFHTAAINRSEPVSGAAQVTIGPYHWADSNGDGRIDDNEIMPAYYLCEEMKDFHLDWKLIEAIWSGKGYRWSPRDGYTVRP